jgi:Rps23 Pro-64 3,4-dihydroxylase Tpa1-like proline 4-hydroxylase
MKERPLKEWLNPKYISESFVDNCSKKFKEAKPFHYLEIKEFFKPEKINEIEKSLRKEDFFLKESDLFKVMQTNDIISSNQKVLGKFREFLMSEEFISYIEKITKISLRRGIIDLAGSIYEDTYFLLCHDDLIKGRRIAFLIYLSTMKKGEGGALALLGKDMKTEARIIPEKNTFAFFEVSPFSYHEIEEVIARKQRIALGGWLHD